MLQLLNQKEFSKHDGNHRNIQNEQNRHKSTETLGNKVILNVKLIDPSLKDTSDICSESSGSLLLETEFEFLTSGQINLKIILILITAGCLQSL